MCIHFTDHLHILCVALKPLLRSEEEKYLPVARFLSESMFREHHAGVCQSITMDRELCQHQLFLFVKVTITLWPDN